jgi:hypothetical protein
MADHIETSGQHSSLETNEPIVIAEEAAERALARAIVKSVLISVPLMIAFWVLLVVVAVGDKDPDWGPWLGMAAGIGVLAGVFFGAWAGFVAKAHVLDDIDLHTNRPLPNTPQPHSVMLSQASAPRSDPATGLCSDSESSADRERPANVPGVMGATAAHSSKPMKAGLETLIPPQRRWSRCSASSSDMTTVQRLAGR